MTAALIRNGTELADAWRDFLGTFHWEWFCTLTFREATHPEAAYKKFGLWVGELNDSIFGNNWRTRAWADGGLHWVCALEWQRRGVLHFHALLGGRRALGESGVNDDLYRADRMVWARRWGQLAGFAKLDMISDQDRAVCGYVSKYVAKGGAVDLSRNCGIRGRLLAQGVAAA